MRIKYSKCVYSTVSDLIDTSDLVSLVPLDKINWSPDHRTPSCDCPRNFHSHQVHIRFYYTMKGRCMFLWQQDLQLSYIVIRKHHVALHMYVHIATSHIKIKFCTTVNACTYCTRMKRILCGYSRWGHVECTPSANT